MRFLLDEDLHPGVAEIGRRLGLDIRSVHEIDRRGYSDREQLAFAASQGRALVTRNRDDFIRLTVECFQTGAPHAGVLIVPYSLPNHRPRWICEAIVRWLERHPDPETGALFIDFLSAASSGGEG